MILLTCHLNFHLVWLNFNQFLLSGTCLSQALGKQGLYICNTNEMCAVRDQHSDGTASEIASLSSPEEKCTHEMHVGENKQIPSIRQNF